MRGEMGDIPKMKELLELKEDEEPILAQSIGFFKEKKENGEYAYMG